MSLEQMKQRLIAAYPEGDVEVLDLTGTQDHYQVTIASPQFKGLTRIQQHQNVMAVFADELKSGEVHALTIRATPK